MRILHILVTLRASGAETMLRCAADAFRSHGVSAEILATGSEAGLYAPVLAQAGYPIHHIPFRKHPAFFLALHRLIRSGRYDVVHMHAEQASFWTGLLARLHGARVVRTVHNAFPFDGALRWRRGVQRRWLARLGVQFVAIGPSVAQNERTRFGLDPVVVANWYDCARFTPPTLEQRRQARAALGIAQDAFVITSIGNCNAVKNHASVLDALGRMPHAERPLYLHAGHEEAGQPERAMAGRLGVAEHIRFLGALDDVLPALHAADAYVMPSLHEGFSIAAIEALACGLPAVIAEVPGLRDLAVLGDGVYLTGTDGGTVAAGIARVRAIPPAERAEIGMRLARSVRERFGIAPGVAGYCTLYQQAGV